MTQPIARRDFFSSAADGLTGTALAYLFGRDLYGGSGLLAGAAVGRLPRRRVILNRHRVVFGVRYRLYR